MMEKIDKAPSYTASTIAAIASALGRGGVGVIRVSGNDLLPFAKILSRKTPKPRIATLADFYSEDGEVIDTGLLLYFPAPHSFTGEDVLELQGHGGIIVQQMLLARCLTLGACLAAPGEFTQRAYLNGKLDLAQAEAVADLIDASSTAAARSAARSMQGEFSREVNRLQKQLTELRALVEASLDFSEEDIDFIETCDIKDRVHQLQLSLAKIFGRATQGKLLQSGLNVVLVGQPNVGKSSLLNSLSGDELAIVTPVAGTTRDTVKSLLQIEGVPLHIIDTAGLHDTEDEIEKIGISRTWQEIERADAAVLIVDAREGIKESDRAIFSRLPKHLARITALNKIDLIPERAKRHENTQDIIIALSAKTGDGVELLRTELLKIAGWHPTEDAFIARERHLRALDETSCHINEALKQLPRLEFFAEEIRLAQNALGSITGTFTADDLLGEIFGRFCIGK